MMGTSAEHEQGLMGRKPPHRSILYKKANNFPRRESYLPSSRTNSVLDKKRRREPFGSSTNVDFRLSMYKPQWKVWSNMNRCNHLMFLFLFLFLRYKAESP